MASIVVRDLDDSVKAALVAQATAHGRSMEAEVRLILGRATAAVRSQNIGLALRDVARRSGGVDLEIAERTDEAGVVDLS